MAATVAAVLFVPMHKALQRSARLRVELGDFDLVIDTEHSNHHCRVVWRKARWIGVAFD
jgi:hypothetical protein